MAVRTETQWVDWLRSRTATGPSSGVLLGVGDDGAVADAAGRGALVLATDQVIETVHFTAGERPERVGRKAVARAVSDLAAMAARPWLVLTSLALPSGRDDAETERLLAAVGDATFEQGAAWVGGDLSRTPGPLTLDVTVVGTLEGRSATRRDGAQVGDRLGVTGVLGGSRGGHEFTFVPRWREALALATTGAVRAAIDLSDGLGKDLPTLLDASGRGARVEVASVPRRSVAGRRVPFDAAWGDGEDFELLVAVDPARWDAACDALAPLGTVLTGIGEVLPLERWLADEAGATRPFPRGGHEHRFDGETGRDG